MQTPTPSQLFMAHNLVLRNDKDDATQVAREPFEQKCSPSSDDNTDEELSEEYEDDLDISAKKYSQGVTFIPMYKTSRGVNSEATISAYNNFVRRVIDSTLDRRITFCEQPRHAVHELERICCKAWPQLENRRHRNRIRAYLKACRRNAKKNSGHINMKEPPLNSLSHEVRQMVRTALEFTEKDVKSLKQMMNSSADSPLEKFCRDSSKLENSKHKQTHMTGTAPIIYPLQTGIHQSPVQQTSNPSIKIALQLFMAELQKNQNDESQKISHLINSLNENNLDPKNLSNFQLLLHKLITNEKIKNDDIQFYARNPRLANEAIQYTKLYLTNLLKKLSSVEEHLNNFQKKNSSSNVESGSSNFEKKSSVFQLSLLDFIKNLSANGKNAFSQENSSSNN